MAKKRAKQSLPWQKTDASIEIGKRVKAARLRNDLTQPELAKRAGIGQSTVSKCENGYVVNKSSVQKMAKAMDETPAWLEYAAAGLDDMPRDVLDFGVDVSKEPEEDREWVLSQARLHLKQLRERRKRKK